VLGLPCAYVVLRPDQLTTVERAVGRGPGELTDEQPARFVWEQFANLGHLEDHVIDSGSLDVEETVAAVSDAMAKSVLAAPSVRAKLD